MATVNVKEMLNKVKDAKRVKDYAKAVEYMAEAYANTNNEARKPAMKAELDALMALSTKKPVKPVEENK
jgi:CRISPR/Cas system-associated protein Cas7 (RAMP superfamily)